MLFEYRLTPKHRPHFDVELNPSWYLLTCYYNYIKLLNTLHKKLLNTLILPLNFRAYRNQIVFCPIEKHSLGKFLSLSNRKHDPLLICAARKCIR